MNFNRKFLCNKANYGNFLWIIKIIIHFRWKCGRCERIWANGNKSKWIYCYRCKRLVWVPWHEVGDFSNGDRVTLHEILQISVNRLWFQVEHLANNVFDWINSSAHRRHTQVTHLQIWRGTQGFSNKVAGTKWKQIYHKLYVHYWHWSKSRKMRKGDNRQVANPLSLSKYVCRLKFNNFRLECLEIVVRIQFSHPHKTPTPFEIELSMCNGMKRWITYKNWACQHE